MFLILSVSIGYSSFSTSLNITGLVTKVREKADIRITDLKLSNINNEGQSSYQEYNKENISVGVNLINSNSTVTYKVEITNIGNTEMGISSIEGLPENLEYELTDYTLKNKICDSNDSSKCTLGAIKEFYITIKYKENGYDSSNTSYDINLSFTFKQAYDVTYEGITNNNYPTSVLEGETLIVEFTETIPKVVPYINETKVEEYTYESNTITVENVTEDILLKYQEKAYLTKLTSGTYFKESSYLTKIKTITFQDTIDTAGVNNAIATYDLSKDQDKSIIGWIDSSYNLYIGSEWDIYSTDLSYAFRDMSGVTSITFNNLNTSEATTMYSMFNGASSLTSLDVSSFNTAKVTSMKYMFTNMSSLTSLDVSNFDTSKVTNMAYMFDSLKSLTSLDISNFNTSNVTDMSFMFYYDDSLTSLNISSFNTAKVTSMKYMFTNMSSLTSLDVSNFDTSKVTSMERMFQGVSKITELDVSNFNTSNVTSMYYMFKGMSSLTSLDVSKFNTSQVTEMSNMFESCSSLISLNVSNFNTSNVTSMYYMFKGMSSLTSLDVSKFDTSKVTSMGHMFDALSKITELDVSSFDTSKVTSMHYMFNGMSSLTKLDLTSFDTSKVTNMALMFKNTNSIKEILVSDKWVIGTSTDVANMFTGSGVSSVTLKQ